MNKYKNIKVCLIIKKQKDKSLKNIFNSAKL